MNNLIKGDKVIWAVIIILSMFSILAVYSATGTLAYSNQGGNTLYYLIKHSFFLLIGIAIIIIIHHINYEYFLRLSQLFMLIAIPLLLITLVFGTNLNEARRWLTIPIIEMSFQTSDFAKLSIILYIARILAINQNKGKELQQKFIPIAIYLISVCLLVLPYDFSTAVILFVIALILMYIGRIKIKYLLILCLSILIAISFFVLIAKVTDNEFRVNTWQTRIEQFMDENEDDFQTMQSKDAIKNRVDFGKGPGNSVQRNYLPHPYSDFIYAIIIEEYGLVGAIIIITMYMFLLFRAGVIVRKSKKSFASFVVIGLTIMLVFQAFINMAVSVNLFPVTGQTLPLVSMGGSSILFTSITFGIILSVSRKIKEENDDND